jgi:membrane protease YdiL (CAAX protease family)
MALANGNGEASHARGIASYLLITFLGSWILWLGGWSLAVHGFHIPASNLLFQFFLLPGAFTPAAACFIVRRWITREGFADAGLRPNFRRAWPYYLFGAYILPVLVIGSILALSALFKVSQPDFSLHRALSVLLPGKIPPAVRLTPLLGVATLLQLLLVGIPLATFITWGEEFGWRSYLQIRLFARRPLLAAVATGLIWGIWHYPIIFMGYEHYDNLAVGLVVFPVSTVLLSIIFGWLRFRTGSVWAASAAHGATNNFGSSVTFLLFLGGPHFIFVAYLGLFAWIPLGILCAWIIATGQLRVR